MRQEAIFWVREFGLRLESLNQVQRNFDCWILLESYQREIFQQFDLCSIAFGDHG